MQKSYTPSEHFNSTVDEGCSTTHKTHAQKYFTRQANIVSSKFILTHIARPAHFLAALTQLIYTVTGRPSSVMSPLDKTTPYLRKKQLKLFLS